MDRPLHAYAYADVAFDDAIALLAEDPEGLLQDATTASMNHAQAIVSTLRLPVAGFDLDHDIVVELGEFQPVEQLRSLVPISWRARRGHLLFPTVDATLEIAALSLVQPRVQVTLSGTYVPPMGPLGQLLDRTVTHGLAEAVIHNFVHDVARRLEERLAQSADALPIPLAMQP